MTKLIQPKEIIFFDNQVEFYCNGFLFNGEINEENNNFIFIPFQLDKKTDSFFSMHYELITKEVEFYYFNQSNF